MKKARLGDVVRYKGRLAEVVGMGEGVDVILRYLDNPPCESCGRSDPQVHLLEHSRLFQDDVQPISTVKED